MTHLYDCEFWDCEFWDGETLIKTVQAVPVPEFQFQIVTEDNAPFWNGPVPVGPYFTRLVFGNPVMCCRNNEPVVIYERKH